TRASRSWWTRAGASSAFSAATPRPSRPNRPRSRAEPPVGQPPPAKTHLYGGQAVVEGVMMRGSDHWAVAVREPAGSVYVESHAIGCVAERQPLWRKPFFRGILVLGQSLTIGVRAHYISLNQAF